MTIRRLLSHSLAASTLLFTAAPAFAQAIHVVKVECNGPCSNVRLGEACGPGRATTAISCDATSQSGGFGNRPCGPRATCNPFGDFATGDSLSNYCADTVDNDAMVICKDL